MAPEPLSPQGPARAGPAQSGPGAAALLLALLLSAPVHAQQYLYVCNSHGHTISGGLPPPECRGEDIRELNPDGTLHKLIPAPLTQEQRKKRDLDEEARRQQEENERAQSRKDRALLETYGSVSEIEAARTRTIAGRQVLVDRADQRIAQYAKERKRLDDEAEFYAKREMPAKLKDAFEANKALVAQQEKTKADVQQEIRVLNARYDADIKRYKELEDMAAQAAAARERESGGVPMDNDPGPSR
jgi:hypothetical protein